MNAETINSTLVLETDEMAEFKEKTDQLMLALQTGDFETALRCINEINQINDENLFRIIGKITRGLHNAIADLKISSTEDEATKSRAKAGLGYVIDMTADAAKTTLDMTDQTRDTLDKMSANFSREQELVAKLEQETSGNANVAAILAELKVMNTDNLSSVDNINSNVSEITIAQNYQDLASQSITKSIDNIRSVESSLIALTQHTNLLKQISQFTANPEKLSEVESEELCNSLGKLDLKPEAEHMDQDDVDNLLSSLGF